MVAHRGAYRRAEDAVQLRSVERNLTGGPQQGSAPILRYFLGKGTMPLRLASLIITESEKYEIERNLPDAE